MTRIHRSLALTDPAAGLRAAIATLLVSSGNAEEIPAAGVYNSGLLTVVDTDAAHDLLRSWRWLLPSECCAIMTTGFGDLFLHEPEIGVSFLEAQRGHVEFIDADVDWFLAEFLGLPEIGRDVLRVTRCAQLVAVHGALRYREVFVAEPWPMLGGQDRPASYTIGNCQVYLDLVGQTLRLGTRGDAKP